MTDTVSSQEARSRNIDQLLNDVRVSSYVDGFRAGYASACRWNDVGWGNEEGPLPVSDDTDLVSPDYEEDANDSNEDFPDDLEDEDDTEETEDFGVPPEAEEPVPFYYGPTGCDAVASCHPRKHRIHKRRNRR